MNSVKERLPFLLEGYLAAFALANIGGIATTNIITLVLFLLCFQFFKYAAGRERECALSEEGKKLVHGRSAGSGGQRRWSWVFFIRSVMLRRRMGN